MTRRPTWLAWMLGAAAAAAVLLAADVLTRGAASTGGWRMTVAASVLYAAALVGLGMIMLARTRTWHGAALLSAVTVWMIGWLAPALAVARFDASGPALVMVGTGLVALPAAALLGVWIFLRIAGWHHPRSDSTTGREARRSA
jgi:hypothetical protein